MSNYFIIALNLMSQFNLENITVFSTKSEEVKPKSVCIIMIACTKIQIEKSYFDALFHPDVFTLYSMIFLMMSWRLKRGKWKISQGEGMTNNEKEYNMPSWFVSIDRLSGMIFLWFYHLTISIKMIAGQHQLITTCTGGFGRFRITLESLHNVMTKSLGKHFSRSSVYIFILLNLKQYQNVLFFITEIYLLVFNVMNCTIYCTYGIHRNSRCCKYL